MSAICISYKNSFVEYTVYKAMPPSTVSSMPYLFLINSGFCTQCLPLGKTIKLFEDVKIFGEWKTKANILSHNAHIIKEMYHLFHILTDMFWKLFKT